MGEREEDRCEIHCIHAKNVEAALNSMPEPDVVQSVADIFRVLGDPTRLKILLALDACELCVCDLAAVVGASESSVSHHLRLLRSQRLVKYRREGKVLFYSLDDIHVARLLSQGLEHVRD